MWPLRCRSPSTLWKSVNDMVVAVLCLASLKNSGAAAEFLTLRRLHRLQWKGGGEHGDSWLSYSAIIFFSFTNRGRPSTFRILVSPWMRGSA